MTEFNILDADLPGEHFREDMKPLFEARAKWWAGLKAGDDAEIVGLEHIWGYDREDNAHWCRTTFTLRQATLNSGGGK